MKTKKHDTIVDDLNTTEPPSVQNPYFVGEPANDNEDDDYGRSGPPVLPRAVAEKSKGWKLRADAERAAEQARADDLRRAFVLDDASFPPMPIAADNDNEQWPLETQLRRSGKLELLDAATRYRRTYDAASAAPMFSSGEAGIATAFAMGVEQKVDNKTSPSPIYKGTLSIKGAPQASDGTAKAARTAGDDGTTVRGRVKSMARRWRGEDIIIAAIDARVLIARLRATLGSLAPFVEMAVLENRTYAEIGELRGIGQHASGAGRLVVELGLETLQNEFWIVDGRPALATYTSIRPRRGMIEDRRTAA